MENTLENSLIFKLISLGVKINPELNDEVSQLILEKSFKRHKDIVMAYKRYHDIQEVSWDKINDIYKKDIALRRLLNKHIARLEILLRSHVLNALYTEKANIIKYNNSFSKKYFKDDPIRIKGYIKAKKSFRWVKREVVPLDLFMEESNFSIVIEMYMMLSETITENIWIPIVKSDENYDKLFMIKDKLRNPIAHHAILFTKMTESQILNAVSALKEVCNMYECDYDEIKNLIASIYCV